MQAEDENMSVRKAANRSQKCETPIVIQVGALAFVRTMWFLLWTAFRHPFTVTYIDAETGEIIPNNPNLPG